MRQTLKESSWQSTRQHILTKYDKNGDGVYDVSEVNAIVDDYMATINQNTSLIDTNQNQKKIIMFSALMIILLSISNLGTAFLAVSLAKEVKVSEDGTMTSTDGANTALKTMKKVETMKVLSESVHLSTEERRRLTGSTSFGCFTKEQVERMYNNAQNGSGTNLILEDKNVPGVQRTINLAGSTSKLVSDESSVRLLSDGDMDEADIDFEYHFPDSGGIQFRHAPEECGQRRMLPVNDDDSSSSGSDNDYTGEDPCC